MKHLHRAIRAEGLLNLLGPSQVVHLVHVEVVGLEPPERPLELLTGALGIPHLRLTREVVPVSRQPLQADPHLGLGVPVAIGGGDVEIIDALFKGLVKQGRALGLLVVDQPQTRKAHDRRLHGRRADHPPRQGGLTGRGLGGVQRRRQLRPQCVSGREVPGRLEKCASLHDPAPFMRVPLGGPPLPRAGSLRLPVAVFYLEGGGACKRIVAYHE